MICSPSEWFKGVRAVGTSRTRPRDGIPATGAVGALYQAFDKICFSLQSPPDFVPPAAAPFKSTERVTDPVEL